VFVIPDAATRRSGTELTIDLNLPEIATRLSGKQAAARSILTRHPDSCWRSFREDENGTTQRPGSPLRGVRDDKSPSLGDL
jgi:hypothetical protein